MITKPTLPKGTRDFGPEIMLRRNFILTKIKDVFQKYGYLPLETPAMENLSVLQGKYGEEGDRLLFKILNSGDYLKKSSDEDRADSQKLLGKISEKGLRYDLTVPFARYVASNRHELAMPFKRYQIQPVWRADRPQKGRYREFYQCDADVVGTESLLCEAEIVMMIQEVFQGLNIKKYAIKVNHRKILEGICEYIEAPGKLSDMSVAIDKLDKIGWEGVAKELDSRGFTSDQSAKLKDLMSGIKSISDLEVPLQNTQGAQGLNDFITMQDLILQGGRNLDHLEFDVSLARGLAYYTGTIFEVVIENSGVGSVSGGGRYDDLTGVFGVDGVPGVGFSFGIDRLYDAMESLQLFPETHMEGTSVLIAHFDQESFNYGLKVLSQLRESGISAELYPDLAKMRKQLTYADRKNIQNVIFIGSDERESGNLTIKNMQSGTENSMGITEIIRTLTSING